MPPPLPCHKIILYSPFSHKQYSMAIHPELLKTAISSSSLYFSSLAMNCVFSCLCPYVVVISIFSVLQLSAIFNTRSHPCSFITFKMFTPPSPIPSSSSTLPSLPQPSATTTPTLPPLPPKLCLHIYQNTNRTTIYPVSDLC
ncbi:unnamed protein product [Porites lobata]|uniref:Uncharacterized protein n=1 Tax=Porites lobata TaxID=104759 RepID=A0ABN8R262_9CNID|nr:unnamed protein product [Porites lobata]